MSHASWRKRSYGGIDVEIVLLDPQGICSKARAHLHEIAGGHDQRVPRVACSRVFTFPKAVLLWKKSSTPWWTWPCQADGNRTQATRLLDISRDALRYKLKIGIVHVEEEESG